MKTNKLYLAAMATTAIMALSMGTTSAMGGNGGQGGMSQYVTAEQRAELQNMNETDRQAFKEKIMSENGLESTDSKGKGQGKGKGKGGNGSEGKGQGKSSNGSGGKDSHSTGDILKDIEKQDVDAIEIDLLQKQYEEEMMANELYMSFYDMYEVDTFKNIAESEAKHMEAVKALLDRYDIATPTSYAHIQGLYDTLKAKGTLSLHDALEVGVSIEIVDIDDIVTAIKSTDNDDIKTVFVNIGGGSYNHMRGFVKALDNNDLTTNIDYSNYLTVEEAQSQGGGLKSKLATVLEAEGVELPTGVSSEAVKAKCDKEEANGGHGKDKSSDTNKGQKGKSQSSESRSDNYEKNQATKEGYKVAIKDKYQDKIDTLDNDKLELVIVKVDELLEKIRIGNYSDATKLKYNATLIALKEVILEKIEGEEINIDGLFN